MPSPDALQIALTLGTVFVLYVTVAKALVPMWRWFRNGAGWMGNLFTVVWGRKERVDRVTGEKRKKVPSLVDALVQISEKQDQQGADLKSLTVVVTQVADQQVTLQEHTQQIAGLMSASAIYAEQIGLLKTAAEERIEIRRENAGLFDAIAKRDSDVIDPREAP